MIETLIMLLVGLLIVGLIIYVIQSFLPIDGRIKQIMILVVVIVALLLLLKHLAIF